MYTATTTTKNIFKHVTTQCSNVAPISLLFKEIDGFCTEYGTMPGQCKWWRLSFSAVEKKIVFSADGTLSQSEGRTCYKDVLRLLKDNLAEFYENNYMADKNICSYFVKTIVLHLWEEDQSSWSESQLLDRYVSALQNTVRCLDEKYIEHFFIKSENLLDEKEIPDQELDMIKRYFRNLLENYSRAK